MTIADSDFGWLLLLYLGKNDSMKRHPVNQSNGSGLKTSVLAHYSEDPLFRRLGLEIGLGLVGFGLPLR